MRTIFPISALNDNYIWCIRDNGYCAIVDPGDARPVIDLLEERSLKLCAILLTHHHYDHTNGVDNLLRYQDVPVYGPSEISQVTSAITPEKQMNIAKLNLDFKVLPVPGHTLEHVAYYHPGMVFTGDTLFTAGCGRIFEGTVEQMYQSLATFKSLPPETLIYCGHEYTENNLAFALTVEPNNKDIQERMKEIKELRRKNLPTVPASIKLEKKTNPFLRCDQPDVAAAASHYSESVMNDPISVLKVLREWKNNF